MSASIANVPSDPLDEPPPYTPRADAAQGESTVEFGPSRPFQQPPPRPAQEPQATPSSRYSSPQPTGSLPSRRGRSLWQQLTDQIDQFANELERRSTTTSSRLNVPPQQTGTSSSSYPGQSSTNATASRPTPPRNVPPLPPRRRTGSSSSLPETPSDFARDFYAAGTGDGLLSDDQPASTSNQASRSPQANGSRGQPPSPQVQDRSPTTTPIPGRPLLHEGKLLVYPKGYFCEKCNNTGYKQYDYRKPCKKCWPKYAKPFSGPLAYSYTSSATSSNTQNTNLQQPLPLSINQIMNPQRSSPQQPNRLTRPLPHQSLGNTRPASYSGLHSGPPGGYLNRGPTVHTTSGFGRPPPGATIYRPGDPRIGGDLCWRCNGKVTMNIFIDVINCPICGGCGRTFVPTF